MAFMANKINFQKELDKLLEQNQCEGRIPSLFLHSCCAPCSSYVIEYLSDYFQITVFITIRIFTRTKSICTV